ncbi:hypothetical protein ACQPW3_20270 [Actinosynnema sp. CA-248983]
MEPDKDRTPEHVMTTMRIATADRCSDLSDRSPAVVRTGSSGGEFTPALP